MSEQNKIIGKRIKERRKALKMTQKELGEKIGCAEITIRQYENGRYSPKIDTRIALANALGVSYTDLFVPDQTPMSFDSPEDFDKAWNKATELKDGITRSIKIGYGDHVTNEIICSFRQSGLTESEAIELDNYYSYLMYKRNNRYDRDQKE